MNETIYEFPLKEKVRNYLRVEHIMLHLKQTLGSSEHNHQLYFFEQLFMLTDLFERLDIRQDILRDLDVHEKNLVQWSQHPQINNSVLEDTLANTVRLKGELKTAKKFGTELKEDKFLCLIRQRFAIPGGTCSFDVPSLYHWLHSPESEKQQDMKAWLDAYRLLDECISLVLSFLRQKSQFSTIVAKKGFYQGVADDNSEMVRVKCSTDTDYYPTISGNKYRFALRFIWSPSHELANTTVSEDIQIFLAAC